MDDYRFSEDLKDMSVFELACWLGDCLLSVYHLAPGEDGTYKIDEVALETLYNDFVELINLTEEDAKKYGELGPILLENKTIFESASYKKAIVALHNSLPQVQLNIGKKALIDISRDVYCQPIQKINAVVNPAVSNGALRYRDKIGYILQRPDYGYRKELLEFIRKRNVQRQHIDYALPANQKTFDEKNIDDVIRHLSTRPLASSGPYAIKRSPKEKERAEQEDFERATWVFSRPYTREYIMGHGLSRSPDDYFADEKGVVDLGFKKLKLFGGLHEMEEYSINSAMRSRYSRQQPTDKIFFVKLAFFLGLDYELLEGLLLREGFSVKDSIRPDDTIFRICFKIGFPFEFADTLLKRKGLKRIKSNPKPRKKKSLEA